MLAELAGMLDRDVRGDRTRQGVQGVAEPSPPQGGHTPSSGRAGGAFAETPRSRGVWASGEPEAPSHPDSPPRAPPALASASSLLSCLDPSSPTAQRAQPRRLLPLPSGPASPPHQPVSPHH